MVGLRGSILPAQQVHGPRFIHCPIVRLGRPVGKRELSRRSRFHRDERGAPLSCKRLLPGTVFLEGAVGCSWGLATVSAQRLEAGDLVGQTRGGDAVHDGIDVCVGLGLFLGQAFIACS